MNAEMQDIQGILGGGSGGPIFGDRRVRAAAHQQNLNCPRCDSSNTKFCYYNNYNLSQPRHFCKNCRRYWTNGGVLRNVPVGGGCRKAKRTTKRKASSPAPPSTAIEEGRNKSNSRSSSETNSANTGTKDQSAVATAKSPSEFSSPPLFKLAEQPTPNYAVQEPTKADCSVVNPTFSQLNDSGGREVFTEIGGFVSFMSGNQSQNLFEFDAAPAPFRSHHQNQVNHHHQENQQLMQNWGSDVDLLPNSSSTDWRGVSGGERAQFIGNLFDLTPGNSAAHWSGQSTDQWHESDHDQHLYLPP